MIDFAPIAAACRRGISFVTGFVKEHAPESSVRLCMIWFAATGCLIAPFIVWFAFRNPTAHLMLAELVALVSVFLGTGCCGMALRTRSAESAEAELQKLAATTTQTVAAATQAVETAVGAVSGAVSGATETAVETAVGGAP